MEVRFMLRRALTWLILCGFLTACASLQVGVERTPTPDHAVATIAALATENARLSAQIQALSAATPTAIATPTATPTEPTPTPTTTFTPTATRHRPTPTITLTPTASQGAWRVISLLAAPGTPGRLYAFQRAFGSPGDVRLLFSDSLGQTWQLFPGGLPESAYCTWNVNMDYATPDALYASTCRGLYRWSGASWTRLSPQETQVVAVVYGQPELLWAALPSGSISSPVIRSTDGGRTWSAASDGLIHFNGVAALGVDPRGTHTMYATINPYYAGGHLRRGTADGRWVTMDTTALPGSVGNGITLDGATGALYVSAGDSWGQIWSSPNPDASNMSDVRWEFVYDFGADRQVELLASGWSLQGLALYANVYPLLRQPEGHANLGDPVLYLSPDGGHTWAPLAMPQE